MTLLLLCRYSGLSIKYVRGADPVIKLLDDADEIIEVRKVGSMGQARGGSL